MKDSIRLLIATAEPWPTFRADVAVLFGKYLPRYGVLSDLVAERAAVRGGEVQWSSGKAVLTAGSWGRATRYFAVFAHGFSTLLRADAARYEAFQVRDMPLLALAGLLAAWWKKRPFFYWMSFPLAEGYIELARERGLKSGLMRFIFPWMRGRVGRFVLYRLVLPRADHVFVQSPRMLEDVAARGIARAKMTPVLMGVDFETAQPERVQPSRDPRLAGRRVLVYLGSFDRRRRIDVLLEMLSLVRREFPEALLVLAGEAEDDAHERWLRECARALGLEDAVIWTGWLPTHEAWSYVRAAEIGLSPIPRGPLLDCGSPTKNLEYLALGVPVVGNDNPDQKAVLEASGGGMCVPLGAADFARAVCRLFADPALRAAMAERGRRYLARTRSYELLARELAATYFGLLRSRCEKTQNQVIEPS